MHGTSFVVHGAGRPAAVELKLLGTHQADNALGAPAALVQVGTELDAAIAGHSGRGVPARGIRTGAGAASVPEQRAQHHTG